MLQAHVTRSVGLRISAIAAAAAVAALALTEACVGDTPVSPTDGGGDVTNADVSSGDAASGDGAVGDAGPDVNPNCADAQGAFYAATSFPINGQSRSMTVLAGSLDSVLVGAHISGGLIGPDASIGPSNGQGDALAFRRTPAGAVIWSKSFGGTLADTFTAVASDSAGDLYVVGNFASASFTFDANNITNANSPSLLPVIAKLSGADGSVVWAHPISPANANSSCTQLAIKGDHLAVGCTFSTTTNVPIPDGGTTAVTPLGGVNALVLDVDRATGGAVWTTPLGAYVADAGGATASIDGLDVTVNGDVIASGTFSGPNLQDKPGGNATFTLTRVSALRDGWVGELSPTNGNAQWAKGFGGSTGGSSVSVVRSADDGTGGVLLEASYTGQVNLGSGPSTSNGSDDALIASLKNHAGAPAWQKSFGGVGLEVPQGVTIDDCARPVVAVRVSDALTLDGVVLPAPQANSYAAVTMKLDTTGKVLWANGPTPPSSAFLSIVDITVNPNNGRTLVTGFFGGTIDLGGGNTATNPASGPFFIAYSP